MQTTFKLVQHTLSRHGRVDPEVIFMDTTLEGINIDSLTVAEMLFEFEDTLGVQVPSDSVMPITVADLVALIEPFFVAKYGETNGSITFPSGA
jgi:acyl carrier protein